MVHLAYGCSTHVQLLFMKQNVHKKQKKTIETISEMRLCTIRFIHFWTVLERGGRWFTFSTLKFCFFKSLSAKLACSYMHRHFGNATECSRCFRMHKFPGKPDELKYGHREQRRFSHFSPLMNNSWFRSWLANPCKLPVFVLYCVTVWMRVCVDVPEREVTWF